MAKAKSEKMQVFEAVKTKIEEMLKPLKEIKFGEGELYIVDEMFYAKLMQLDAELSPYKTETRRGSVFSVDTFVAILNPGKVAVSYHLTMATKSKLITDRNKILDRLAGEKEISKNSIYKIAEEKIEQEELDANEAQAVRDNAKKRVEAEEYEFEKISKNPDAYDIIISTFKERKDYPQVNFKYMGMKTIKDKRTKKEKEIYTQISTNKHISIEKPSILIFNENAKRDTYRSDMKVARFIREGYRALGNVYIKSKNTDI